MHRVPQQWFTQVPWERISLFRYGVPMAQMAKLLGDIFHHLRSGSLRMQWNSVGDLAADCVSSEFSQMYVKHMPTANTELWSRVASKTLISYCITNKTD